MTTLTIPARNNRRYRGSGRSMMAVRYPHLDAAAPWGSGHAQRSFVDENAYAPNAGRTPGTGEPDFSAEPSPPRSAHRRHFLSSANSKASVLLWRHTRVSNFGKFAEGSVSKTEQNYSDTWWDSLAVAHPRFGDIRCPTPMSNTALWVRRNPGDEVLYYNNDIPPELITIGTSRQLIETPGDIGAAMTWRESGPASERFSIRRTCSRVFCFRDCHHTGSALVRGTLSFVLREIDWRRTENATAMWRDSSGMNAGPAPECGRPHNDVRFQPFGWAEGVPTFQAANWEMDDVVAYVVPPAPQDIYAAVSKPGFDYADLSYISNSKLFSAMQYCATPYGYSQPALFEADRPFDLVICANFYKFKMFEWDGALEAFVQTSSGFAGAYGNCYAIY